MATVAATNMTGPGARAVVETTLDDDDDGFVYTPRRGSVLIMRNPTGAAISPVIDGDGGTTVVKRGVGEIDVSPGYAVGSIGAGLAAAIPLDTISDYLQGDIAINDGDGLVCSLLVP